MHVRCPHCRNPIEVVGDVELCKVVCPSCGSDFNLAGDETVSYRSSNETIGHFQLVECVGMGHFGAVWRAHDTQLDRTVAIKIPRQEQLDARQIEQFLREARSAAQLRHPNIVSVHEIGRHDGSVYIVSDFVEGLTLADWLTGRRPTVIEAVQLAVKIADALDHAHAGGVIHRDLKPSNIMLDRTEEPHLMDFGLAKREAGEITMTIDGNVLGTPAYMAPEQARGEAHQADRRSDVYSLGVILFELLTGERPFRGNARMLLNQVIHDEAPSPRTLNGTVPKDLETICLKCMEKEPARRYASAADLAADLRRFLQHEPIIARPIGNIERGWRWCRRKPVAAGLIAAIAISLVAVAATVTVSAALYLVNMEKDKAVLAHKEALDSETKAKDAAEDERRARLAAEDSEQKAKKSADDEAMARMEADIKRKEADDQRQIAEKAKRDANENAIEARRQKAIADEFAKSAIHARAAQEYEAYVAQIGLAASKIEENSFENARALLVSCKPEFRNWEWGRLMYLCGQSVRTADSKAPIDSVAFSPDGTKFVTGGWNRTVKIWDTATAAEKLSLPATDTFVRAVAFSPDGETVASAGSDNRIRLWNATTGEPIGTEGGFNGHWDDVLSVAFSRDGSKLLTASYDHTARLWDVKSGREIRSLEEHLSWVWSAAFSPDESQVVTAGQDGSVIVWDLNSTPARRVARFRGHTGPVYTAAYSPDGQFIASGGHDTTILIWRPTDVQAVDSPQPIGKDQTQARISVRKLEGHGGPVHSVRFSIDGRLLLSGSHDNTVRLWDVSDGRNIKILRGHAGQVHSCAFSPDQKTIVSASHDQTVRLWNVFDPEEVRVLQGRFPQSHRDAVLAASFARDGKSLVTTSLDRTVRIWDFRTGAILRFFAEGSPSLVTNAVFSPDGKLLITAWADGTVRMSDSSRKSMRLSDKAAGGTISALAADAKQIVTGGYARDQAGNKARGLVHVWDIETQNLVKSLEGHHEEVTAVAISPNANWLFTGDSQGHGILWNTATFAPVHKLQSHTGRISGAVFLPDSSRLLTASADNTVVQWDVDSGKESLPLVLKHPGPVLAIAVRPNGRQAITCCGDNEVRIWNLDQALVAGMLPKPEKGLVTSISLSTDGRRVLTVNPVEKAVRLWDVENQRELGAPQAKAAGTGFIDLNHTSDELSSAIFSPDEETVITIGGIGWRHWDALDATEILVLPRDFTRAAAAISPDGAQVVTDGSGNAPRIWDTKTGIAILKLQQHYSIVNSLVFSPDGRLILTASDDTTAMLSDAQSGKLIRQFHEHTDGVRAAVFSPDGKRVLTASNDGTAALWSTETGQLLGSFVGHQFAVLSAVFSPDGRKVLTGGQDRTVRLWDVETFNEALPPVVAHTGTVASVAFFPDGKRFLTGSHDGTAKLWDSQTGRELLTLKRHSREVTCVGISTDGRHVVTCSDGAAVVWPTSEWKQPVPP